MSINQQIKKGDKVAHYIKRRTSAVEHAANSGGEQVRRIGTVQGWRDGKVIVLHAAKYTELVAEADLYFLD